MVSQEHHTGHIRSKTTTAASSHRKRQALALLSITGGDGTQLAVIPGCLPRDLPLGPLCSRPGLGGFSPHSERQSREINKDPSPGNLSSPGTELHTYLIIITALLG